MMFLSLDYVVSHRAPPRVSVELPRDHLVKKPGELVAALVPGQMLDLSLQLRWISMMLCLLLCSGRRLPLASPTLVPTTSSGMLTSLHSSTSDRQMDINTETDTKNSIFFL